MNTEKHPRVIVISGPSGVGKSTLIKGALAALPDLRLSVSYTTRRQRDGEEEGRDYSFIGREAFEQRIAAGAFLEWAENYGHYYGTSISHVESILDQGFHALLDLDTQGAMNLKFMCSGVVFIFVRPPSLADLETRLRNRGSESEESLARRLARAESEIAYSGVYDYVIVNDEPGRATEELTKIIQDEGGRPMQFFADPGKMTTAGPAGKVAEDLVEGFARKVAPALRSEMVSLIGSHLNAVLKRDLNSLMRDSYQKYLKENP